MDSLLTLSATELARRIRSGEVSSGEVVERHIARIEEVNPGLNAVVRERFDEARLEAKQADDRTRSAGADALPPLHGVPCTIKESIALTGMPHTSGVVARAGCIADADATPVARLRKAGAIPLGVTNVPELTAWVATFNKVYGVTANAYDVSRVPGGSSGGEGSIVGAGGSPFGIGTDIGGSIRIPAFCNGVFGHKPTGGLVPGSGQVPAYEGAHCRFNCTGPLARRAEDLMPLLRIVAGPDGLDPGCSEMPLGDPSEVDVAGLRVVVVETDRAPGDVDAELRFAQQRAAYALAARGATVEMIRLGELKGSLAMAATLQLEEGRVPIPDDLYDPEWPGLARELVRFALRRSSHNYPPLMALIGGRIGLRMPGWIRKHTEKARAFRTRLEDLLDGGVMLYPSARGVAPRHGSKSATHFRFTGVFNVLEMPSTQTPLGLGKEGLPLGVQVIAARGNDHVTIAVAQELERAFGGWVPPGGSAPC